LLRCADRAMYIAKASGCGVAMFDPGRDDGWRRPPVLLDGAGSNPAVAWSANQQRGGSERGAL